MHIGVQIYQKWYALLVDLWVELHIPSELNCLVGTRQKHSYLYYKKQLHLISVTNKKKFYNSTLHKTYTLGLMLLPSIKTYRIPLLRKSLCPNIPPA